MVWSALLIFLTRGISEFRPGWSETGLFALTCAIIEQGPLRIDAYHARNGFYTEDKVYFEGHYYCDKSPSPLFSCPSCGFACRSQSGEQRINRFLALYFAKWICVGGAAALLSAMLTALLSRRD